MVSQPLEIARYNHHISVVWFLWNRMTLPLDEQASLSPGKSIPRLFPREDVSWNEAATSRLVGETGRDFFRPTGAWMMREAPEIPVQRPAGKERSPGHGAPASCVQLALKSETHPSRTPICPVGVLLRLAPAFPAAGRVESAPMERERHTP
jgi:hypothetical protein